MALPKGHILLALILRLVHLQQCPLRNCLPPDDTQNPPICYQQTLLGLKPATQSFATCPANQKYCQNCSTAPPCESRCSSQPQGIKPLGARCNFDLECVPSFGQCIQQTCKKALYTHQACNPLNAHDACIFGRKSCFRNRCQGKLQGQSCFEGRPEGRDIDCNPGWICLTSICTPQFPEGHRCTGQHPRECDDAYRCNSALSQPICVRQFTLNIGALSGDPSLCKSNHVDPRQKFCANVPAVQYRFNKPTVSGKDCVMDSQCPRTDTSLGKCACKQWWEGGGTPTYCELSVEDVSRPMFRRFWEVRVSKCHHDWSAERCALETAKVEELRAVNNDWRAQIQDPTKIASCAEQMLSTQFVTIGAALPMMPGWLGLATLYLLITTWTFTTLAS